MRASKALILAALVAASSSALATETFTFAGAGVRTVDWWLCHCFDGPESFAWTGAITFDDADGDGTFAGPWSLASNVWNVTNARSLIVTIADGQLVSLSGLSPHLTFAGRNMELHDTEHHFGTIDAYATYALVSHAPEPETWILLLSGLAFVGLLRRKTQ